MWLDYGGHVLILATSRLIQRQWPFMSHHFFVVPHCYPLHKEATLFVHCCKCQTYLKKFICISGCTQHALALTPRGLDVYWRPPADLSNKVFQRANIWLEVASKWCWIRNMCWLIWCWILALCHATRGVNPTCPNNVKHCNLCLCNTQNILTWR